MFVLSSEKSEENNEIRPPETNYSHYGHLRPVLSCQGFIVSPDTPVNR